MFSKKSSSKSTVKNIITLNGYEDKHYVFKDDAFQPLKKLTYNTTNFISSYLGLKDFITGKVSISRSIPDEDLDDILDIKAYEELGLDQANSYNISSYEVETEAEEREFHLFVVEDSDLNRIFLGIKQQTKYIDLIVPAPLLFQPLYTREILPINQVHCFVYFSQNDAFVTTYKNGEYIYSKSIEFSLEEIYDKYCELVGEKVNEKDFYGVLETEGLKSKNETYQQNFMKIFGEVFITINDIIIYAKRAFDIEHIDQLYIGSEKGPIIGLDDYSQNYLGLNSSELNFNFNIENSEWYTDQLQYLMLLSSFEFMDSDYSLVNLTQYPRPPSFVNRASGQFIISTVAAISLSLAYPLTYLIGSYVNDAKIYALNLENNSLTKKSTKYKKILGLKRGEIKKLDTTIKGLSTRYSAKTKTLKAIYNKKVHYRLKSGIFHSIAEDLLKFNVHIDNIKSKNNTLWISLIGSDDRKLTELIKYISEVHFDELKAIEIERIQKDSKNDFYTGILKVELK